MPGYNPSRRTAPSATNKSEPFSERNRDECPRSALSLHSSSPSTAELICGEQVRPESFPEFQEANIFCNATTAQADFEQSSPQALHAYKR